MKTTQATGPEEAGDLVASCHECRKHSILEADAAISDAADASASPAALRAGPGGGIPARFPLRLAAAAAADGHARIAERTRRHFSASLSSSSPGWVKNIIQPCSKPYIKLRAHKYNYNPICNSIVGILAPPEASTDLKRCPLTLLHPSSDNGGRGQAVKRSEQGSYLTTYALHVFRGICASVST